MTIQAPWPLASRAPDTRAAVGGDERGRDDPSPARVSTAKIQRGAGAQEPPAPVVAEARDAH